MIKTRHETTMNNSKYSVLVHLIDGIEFATMYKDNQFLHRSKWNEEEKQLADNQVIAAKNVDPIKTIWI